MVEGHLKVKGLETGAALVLAHGVDHFVLCTLRCIVRARQVVVGLLSVSGA